ncbi:hypothetical protein VHEMI01931 [[Torrubiella] hemipterigena]|uniref:Uncharacterized protein n=1 Tax=[Torrubiella] hemipterigena TaxID=1531966 RepID=A0A0A1SUC2_9HYPO|nr:hypothetical protein VHEMI01931 [[Torrubiella] hemipterigena]
MSCCAMLKEGSLGWITTLIHRYLGIRDWQLSADLQDRDRLSAGTAHTVQIVLPGEGKHIHRKTTISTHEPTNNDKGMRRPSSSVQLNHAKPKNYEHSIYVYVLYIQLFLHKGVCFIMRPLG